MTDDKEDPKPLDDLPTVDGDSSSEPEYKVGPGHPPKEYRWKKGCPSPHPKGRTPKDPVLSDLKKIFEEAINKKYKVKKGDKDVFLTRMALGIDQVLNKFAKGDRHAWSMLTEMADNSMSIFWPVRRERFRKRFSQVTRRSWMPTWRGSCVALIKGNGPQWTRTRMRRTNFVKVLFP